LDSRAIWLIKHFFNHWVATFPRERERESMAPTKIAPNSTLGGDIFLGRLFANSPKTDLLFGSL